MEVVLQLGGRKDEESRCMRMIPWRHWSRAGHHSLCAVGGSICGVDPSLPYLLAGFGSGGGDSGFRSSHAPQTAGARAELRLWAMRCGSQPRGTWQFSMTHQTEIFAVVYSPSAAVVARSNFTGGEVHDVGGWKKRRLSPSLSL
jgi:hypothetical protein